MLITLEFVGTMRVADCDCEGVHARGLDKIDSFTRVRVYAAFGIPATFLTIVVLRTDQHPKFTLYNTVVFVCVFNYFLAYDNVLL